MASGFPDWFTGSLIHGKDGDTLRALLCDAAGFLTALLKGDYLGTPTTLACDADGNIHVNLKVASTTTPIVPAVPPQNIPVAIGVASGNFPVDIAAQSLATIAVRQGVGTLDYSQFQEVVASGETVTIFDETAELLLFSFYVQISGTTTPTYGDFDIDIDGTGVAALSINELLNKGYRGTSGWFINPTHFDPTNGLFTFTLSRPLHVKSRLVIRYHGQAPDTPTVQSRGYFYTL